MSVRPLLLLITLAKLFWTRCSLSKVATQEGVAVVKSIVLIYQGWQLGFLP